MGGGDGVLSVWGRRWILIAGEKTVGECETGMAERGTRFEEGLGAELFLGD